MDHERREMSEKRETVNAAMDQAIPRLAGNIATGRVEDSILFPKKFAQSADFRKNKKEYHAAAGESAIHSGEHLVWNRPRTLCQ
ncbi:MAG: hypothetical protein ACLFVO_19795 [Chloroflexaceae bacterium]